VLQQVIRGGFQPSRMGLALSDPLLRPCSEQTRQKPHGGSDFVRPHGKAVVRLGAKERRRTLDRVDAAHFAAGLHRAPGRRKLTGVRQPARRCGDEIAFDPENPIGLAEVEYPLGRLAEAGHRGGELIVAMERLPLMPAHARELLLQLGELRCERGRADRAGQDPQSVAFALQKRGCTAMHRAEEAFPCGDLSVAHDRLGAARIVKLKNAGLDDGAGRPKACGMIRISLHLDGSCHLVGDQHTGRVAVLSDRGRIVAVPSGNHVFGLLHVGQKLPQI
jgi:hypothetical protein